MEEVKATVINLIITSKLDLFMNIKLTLFNMIDVKVFVKTTEIEYCRDTLNPIVTHVMNNDENVHKY